MCRSHTGGASAGPADHFLLAELVLGEVRGVQAGPCCYPVEGSRQGAFPPGGTPGLALVGWARGSVYRQPSLWRREPRGEGGAGASDWKSEALGSACLMKERGANGDTEILIRGSLWGGIYYSALIGCMVASQHPGPGPGATKL